MKISKSLQPARALVFLCCAFLFSAAAHAELRVLVKFDSAGHHLQRIVILEATRSALIPGQPAKQTNVVSLGSGFVRWLNSDGVLLLSESIDDPRLTHAPIQGSGTAHELIVLSNGAYMLTGPLGGRTLEVSLPANVELGLEAQTWRFQLDH